MSKVQMIEIEGRRAYLVPADIWERVKAMVEDAQDAAAYAEAQANDDGFRVPHAVVLAEIDGAHPVKAWRDFRGLTLQALADAAGVSKPYVSQIEGGKRAGTTATLKKLVGVLGSSFIKQSAAKCPYRKIYDDYKHRLEHSPAHAEKSKGHRHNMAVRYAVKRFLADLYVAWRTLEGLPVAKEYSEDKLGIIHHKAA